jgi:serine/threonine protein kinase
MPGDLEIGEVLDGRYRIDGILGRGGFSTVYLAEQLRIERQVAIKVLDVGDVEETTRSVARFVREAKAAAKIDHPNVVTIHDAGLVAPNRPYIVMQRYHGMDLKRYLDQHGPFRAEEALPQFVACLDALAEAHTLGIIHRDLKPQNIVIAILGGSNAAWKIIDFGTVFLLQEQAQLTADGKIVGSVAYLAPEYIDRQEVSFAVDVYQMGLVLVECLCGRPAVRGQHPVDYINNHLNGRHDIPDKLRESILGPILARALAVDPGQRFPNAMQFANALRDIDFQEVPQITAETEIEEIGLGGELVSQQIALHSADIDILEDADLAAEDVRLEVAVDEEPTGIHLPSMATPRAGVYSTEKTLTRTAEVTSNRSEESHAPSRPEETAERREGAKATKGFGSFLWGALVMFGLLVAFQVVKTRLASPGAVVTRAPTGSTEERPTQGEKPLWAPQKIEVVVEPSHATIEYRDETIGVGRATLLFDNPDVSAYTIRVDARGYHPQTRSVQPTEGPTIRVRLAKKRDLKPKRSPPKVRRSVDEKPKLSGRRAADDSAQKKVDKTSDETTPIQRDDNGTSSSKKGGWTLID